ncbi:DUF6503 family protein [Flavobacteriaceae bacterium S356]|uniref:DUF6503 family protein n=1 Tax=Asprobacillus argus TaxID=3076534 RepID=A0ABU3LHG8_9FLAO|nr:DUF6503 family protein [Flavobacteriaceae bacterium S356]
MRYILLCFIIFLGSCNSGDQNLTGKDIIAKSIQKHDSNNKWSSTDMHLRIQEPRFQNPVRYSIVKLNNKTGAFSLQRNRDHHVSNHIIDEQGNATTYLDGKTITDTLLIKKYRLDPSRNTVYRRFYQSLMGLPMSLHIEKLDSIGDVSQVIFNDIRSYMVPIELEKPLFSKHWNLFFSRDDFSMIGIEMIFPDDLTKGERLFFEGSANINGVTIPRHKHWHDLSGEYLGSDIIIKEITKE